MTAGTLERGAGRGRQPAEVELQRDSREELRAHLAESQAFAEAVLAAGRFLSDPRPANVVVNLGGRLAYHATRRLAQLGSVVL